jgi:heavy metal sensor kinase
MVKSLRWRLLAWHAAILVLTVAGFGAALYYQIRQARLTEIGAELQAAARSLEGTLRAAPPSLLDGFTDPPRRPWGGRPFDAPPGERRDPPRPLLPPPRESPSRRLERTLTLPSPDPQRAGVDPEAAPYFVVWLGNGHVFKASSLPPDIPAPTYHPEAAEIPGRVEVRQRAHYREIVISGPRQTQVLVGRSIRREQGELMGLAWRLGLTGMGVLGVGLIGGLLLASRAVRPLAVMSATAASISVSNLDRRIDVKEVDSELGKLASILNEMFARLESAFEQQTRFTADASHELRTPLTVIHSHVELALSRPRSPEEYQETLETCVRASRRMKALVEGLLTLARSDAGKLELRRQPLDLAMLVSDVASLLEPLAAQKNVHLSLQAAPLEMMGDLTRLSQVVTNLVSNAINYNRPKGNVSVTLEADGGDAVLTVADTGCGIPEEDRLHVFERFYRVDKARSRELGGSGLGLAICKSIVEGHGGSIHFTSEVNRGTTFVVRLPRGSASSASETALVTGLLKSRSP